MRLFRHVKCLDPTIVDLHTKKYWIVMPAQAGIHTALASMRLLQTWIPSFEGMTVFFWCAEIFRTEVRVGGYDKVC